MRQSTSVFCSLASIFAQSGFPVQVTFPSGTTWGPVFSPWGLWAKLVILVGTFINCLLFLIYYAKHSTYAVQFNPFNKSCLLGTISFLRVVEDLGIQSLINMASKKKKKKIGVPVVAQRVKNPTVSVRLQDRSLASLTGLSIWCSFILWHRLQLWLQFDS